MLNLEEYKQQFLDPFDKYKKDIEELFRKATEGNEALKKKYYPLDIEKDYKFYCETSYNGYLRKATHQMNPYSML